MTDSGHAEETGAWYHQRRFWSALEPVLFPQDRLDRAAEEVDGVLRLFRCSATIDGGSPPRARASGETTPAILDLCCGPGRHAVEFARRGYRVIGVDLTPCYLEKAKQRADAADVKIELVREDMRDFVRPECCDLCVNMFSSFGYFADPDDDARVATNIHHSLRPGGLVLFEMMSKEVLARRFQSRDWHHLDDDTIMLEERRLDHHWTWIENTWTLIRAGEIRSFSFSHRLYSAAELERTLTEAGFIHFRAFGSLEGQPYDHQAQRLIAIAEKPA